MLEDVFDCRDLVWRDKMWYGSPCRVFGKVRAVDVKPEQVGQGCPGGKNQNQDLA